MLKRLWRHPKHGGSSYWHEQGLRIEKELLEVGMGGQHGLRKKTKGGRGMRSKAHPQR